MNIAPIGKGGKKMNIYCQDKLNEKEYTWDQKAFQIIKKDKLMTLLFKIVFIVAVIVSAYGYYQKVIVFSSLFLIYAAILALDTGVTLFYKNKIMYSLRKESYATIHDVQLYYYYKSKNQKVKQLRLLQMAQMNALMQNNEHLKESLDTIKVDTFTSRELKIYYLLQTLQSLNFQDEANSKFYERSYYEIKIDEPCFDLKEELEAYKQGDKEKINSKLSILLRNKQKPAFLLISLLTLCTTLSLFYAALMFSLPLGYELRYWFSNVVCYSLEIGWCVTLIYFLSKTKINKIIKIILDVCIVVFVAAYVFLTAITIPSEKVIHEGNDTYLYVNTGYDSGYDCDIINPFIRKQRKVWRTNQDDTTQSSSSDTITTLPSNEQKPVYNGDEKSYQALYDYLNNQGLLANPQFEYELGAKGQDRYIIDQKEDVTSYLEKNQELQDENNEVYDEIVFQNTSGEIYGFYRVYHDTLEVVDEQRTNW